MFGLAFPHPELLSGFFCYPLCYRSKLEMGVEILKLSRERQQTSFRLLPARMEPEEITSLLKDGYWVAYSILHDEDDAQDCVIASIAAVITWPKVPDDVRAFFLSTVKRRAISMLRRRRVQTEYREVEPHGDFDQSVALDPYQQTSMNETYGVLLDEVGTLPTDTRMVTILYYFKGRDLEDIARQLDIPVGTVKSQLSRARRKLEKALRSRGIDEEYVMVD